MKYLRYEILPGGEEKRIFWVEGISRYFKNTVGEGLPALSVFRSMRIVGLISAGADSISGRNKAIFYAFVPAGSFHRFAVPLPPGGRQKNARRFVSHRSTM